MAKFKENLTGSGSFGERLRFLRKKQGLSQAGLTKKIGFKTSGSVSNAEINKTPVDNIMLEKVADILNVDLHWLITGDLSPSATQVADALKPFVLAHLNDVVKKMQDLEDRRSDLSQAEDKAQILEVQKESDQLHSYCDKILQTLQQSLKPLGTKATINIDLTQEAEKQQNCNKPVIKK